MSEIEYSFRQFWREANDARAANGDAPMSLVDAGLAWLAWENATLRAQLAERDAEIAAKCKRLLKLVADEAWGIAYKAGCDPAVCLAIEALSDDPETSARLLLAALGPRP